MVRRIFTIPLCVILTIAAFSFQCFALPDNIITADYGLSFQAYQNGSGGFAFITSGSNGSMYALAFKNSDSLSYQCKLSSGVPAGSFDVYIGIATSAISHFDFGTLSSYYKPAKNLTETLSLDTKLRELRYDGMAFTSTTYAVTYDVTYMCFSNVPSEFTFEITDTNPATVGGSSGTYVTIGSVTYPVFVFGVFISEFQYTAADIITDYENGDISYSDAISDINNQITENVGSAETTDQAILEVLLGQQKLDQLTQISNDKSLSNITETMQPSLDNTIDNFVSGSTTLESALGSLGSTFDSQLGLVETPEQAQTVAITYQVALKKLELQAQIKAAQNLDDAISDDEMAIMKDYYEDESELIERFDIESFSSQLAYDTWLLQLPSDEAIEYRKFFDYIMQDSPLRLFIIIPMSMGLVSLVLGTSIGLVRRYGHSRGDDND